MAGSDSVTNSEIKIKACDSIIIFPSLEIFGSCYDDEALGSKNLFTATASWVIVALLSSINGNTMRNRLFIFALCLASNSWAGVYKCTDAEGRTDYRSSPCTEADKAVKMNTKTGGSVDLNAEEQKRAEEIEQKKQQEMQDQAQQQAKLDEISRRQQMAIAQFELTQAMIKQSPNQFSAYAIPKYEFDKLPQLVKSYEERLPDIEKFRRLAAKKALATGKCQRVEADELNVKSTRDALVILVNCSSGAAYYYNEAELKE